ncbi:MAG TPA: hypothetical protein VHO25_15120 [Polyangiaceae bacterium]|nr:hypothetical protein [Polyangiaceae bacterium]
MTLLGAPGTGPKLQPGGKAPGPGPIVRSAPSIRLPANATRATTQLVPNLPGGPKTSRTAGQPWFLRPFSTTCVPGAECLVTGYDFGQHAPGQSAPAGMYLSFYTAGTTVSDTRLVATAWTASVIGFKVPATMHSGQRYTLLVRDTQGKAISNGVTVSIQALPDPAVSPDFDQDGERSIAAGGTDCDDFNKHRAPARTEVGDANDLDEDCNTETFGRRDLDSDGYPDVNACNVGITGTGLDRKAVWYCGSDCNDSQVAIFPGEMACDARDPTLIFVCKAQTSWTVDPRMTANDGCMTPYTCSSMVAGGQCVHQPNGRGVCQAASQ